MKIVLPVGQRYFYMRKITGSTSPLHKNSVATVKPLRLKKIQLFGCD
ncbi:hypothetical protein HMPREF9089_01318 [Eubacterium brachy ATCC 33089]|nr:hypothetical protein HMPREF9089_01318 [Eubacterium brachy ATCC 33089]